MPEAMPTTQPAAPVPSWAILLEQFYNQSGHPLPRIQSVEESQVPEPYKSLLVHSSDMTPTLEKFYGQPLGITVLNRELQSDSYLREVLLNLAGEGASSAEPKHVEYGVIRIFLNHFPPGARRFVLDQQKPLGSILKDEALPHSSWPQGYFRVEADARLAELLRLASPCELYGRRNILLDGSRHVLAEVIEILAPVDRPPARGETAELPA